MKIAMQGLLIASMLIPQLTMGCTIDGSEGIVPENNLRIPAHIKSVNGVTKERFDEIIDEISHIYAPIVAQEGAELNVIKNWDDATVNAYAQQIGKEWRVSMFGGLARHEAITEDGLALVVCHELGHHIGGAPRKNSPWSSPWASNEGQSDYFATLKCLRRVWNNDNNLNLIRKMEVPKHLKEACGMKHIWNDDYAICIRGGMAGMSVAKLFQSLRKETNAPAFDTPDAKVVTKTNDNHPATQCRLDTYFQGALCEVSFNQDVDGKDEVKGTCHGSLGHKSGLRPNCWFKPSVE
jgi:hypothetical protein